MTDPSRLESGALLAKELKRIRELRNISLEEMHAETKIPRPLLESFEKVALFDHAQFNRVYLRSFVRTYAASIGISPEAAADALEEAFEGRYSGALAETYLRDEATPLPPVETDDVPPSEDDAPAADEVATEETVAGRFAESRPSRPGRAAQVPEEPAGEVRPPRPTSRDEDWAATSPPSRRPVARERKARRSASGRPRRSGATGWAVVLLGVVILAGLIWLFASVLRSPVEVGPEGPAPAGADAEEAEVVEPEPPPPRPVVELGETMVFHVIAAHDKVDPIRVTVDDDVRRPYWIDEGDSLRFEARERIVFEELLDNIELDLQGYRYPTDQRDPQGRIVVTRDSAESYFERLAAQ